MAFRPVFNPRTGKTTLQEIPETPQGEGKEEICTICQYNITPGILDDGSFCGCKIGTALRKLEERTSSTKRKFNSPPPDNRDNSFGGNNS